MCPAGQTENSKRMNQRLVSQLSYVLVPLRYEYPRELLQCKRKAHLVDGCWHARKSRSTVQKKRYWMAHQIAMTDRSHKTRNIQKTPQNSTLDKNERPRT